MRTLVIVDRYDTPTLTFVRAQVRLLGAEVVALYPNESATAEHPTFWLPRDRGAEALRARAIRALEWRFLDRYSFMSLSRGRRRALDRVLRGGDYDVAVLQFGPVAIATAAACTAAAIPYVVHFHGRDLSAYLRDRRYVGALKRMLENAAGVIVPFEGFAQKLRAQFAGRSSSIAVVPYGVHLADRPVAIPPLCSAFVYVGRLVPKKDPLGTLRAFATGAGNLASTTLTYVGDGPLRAGLESEIRRLGLGARVTLTGTLDHKAALDRMRLAHAFIQLNRTAPDGDREGSPLAVSEASGAGLPVVSTMHAGIPDRVLDGQTGYLVEEEDYTAASRAVRALATRIGEGARLGSAGRDFTIHRFGEEAWRRSLLTALERFVPTA